MLLTIFLRTLFLYFLILALTRIMGKREIGRLQPIDLVVAIMIADAAVIAIEETRLSLLVGVVPIVTLTAAQIALSYFALKSEKAGVLICGTPSVIIEKGRIVEEEMRKLRYNLNDLLEQLRDKGIASIDDVEYAILETTGKLSIIPKPGRRPVQARDLGLEVDDVGLPASLIIDGRLHSHTLKKSGKTESWLMGELRDRGLESYNDVFFATLDETGRLFVQPKKSGS